MKKLQPCVCVTYLKNNNRCLSIISVEPAGPATDYVFIINA